MANTILAFLSLLPSTIRFGLFDAVPSTADRLVADSDMTMEAVGSDSTRVPAKSSSRHFGVHTKSKNLNRTRSFGTDLDHADSSKSVLTIKLKDDSLKNDLTLKVDSAAKLNPNTSSASVKMTHRCRDHATT